MMTTGKADLRRQLLRAALQCCGGDLRKSFSSEELLVAAWEDDNASWGLRGYERIYPDSNRIHRELDSRGKGQQGVVGSGFLEKVRPRTYRLTPKGLAEATKDDARRSQARERTDRVFEVEVRQVIEHPAFIQWLKDPEYPKNFREAGHFWGVAPGTPPDVVRRRVGFVDDTLEAAGRLLLEKDQVGDHHGRLLFDAVDVRRASEFQEEMKNRFHGDLMILTKGEFP